MVLFLHPASKPVPPAHKVHGKSAKAKHDQEGESEMQSALCFLPQIHAFFRGPSIHRVGRWKYPVDLMRVFLTCWSLLLFFSSLCELLTRRGWSCLGRGYTYLAGNWSVRSSWWEKNVPCCYNQAALLKSDSLFFSIWIAAHICEYLAFHPSYS